MKRFVIIFSFFCLASAVATAQSPADSMLDFIAGNRLRASVYLVRNDTVLAHLNEDKMMPLASTVKLMVAIEFAKQAASHVIDENGMVGLDELDKYYISNTDGGAHPQWLTYEKAKGNIKDSSVSLLDVARGMMIFSSNANTEYLMDLLGFDNVKNNIQLLGIQPHTAIYPLVASMFMYQNPKKKSEASILKGISKLDDQQYSRYIYDMHNALKYGTALKSKFNPQEFTENMQKVWSSRLPSSTAKQYAKLCRILNNRKFFDDDTYALISETVETVMENPANRQWLKHAGMKGGSTAWVLTRALYGTTKTGTKVELVYFFNGLQPEENDRLQKWMNAFELKVLSDEGFRQKITLRLNPTRP